MSALLAQEMLILFAILAIGVWLGGVTVRGVSLGSAGVLFTAMIFGHFGLNVPKPIMDLGLLLFVYAVGLQAGAAFFSAPFAGTASVSSQLPSRWLAPARWQHSSFSAGWDCLSILLRVFTQAR
ncbi:MAG: hypothetical protein M5U05_06490 [Anaerolineales bacterium]|nr:hypothetical protein [Anaerolineales bacterium]